MDELIELMRRLRDPEHGCPWDRAQTFETIAPYTIEEAYEVADAITRGDLPDLVDELGDLLFQVVFHARMAEELGAFDIQDVVHAIVTKMVRRHPHVFPEHETPKSLATGDHAPGANPQSAEPPDLAQVQGSWEAIKAAERAAKRDATGPVSALDEVTAGLPALKRAAKLQARARRTGFDWPAWHGVIEKLHEEVGELEQAIADQGASRPGPNPGSDAAGAAERSTDTSQVAHELGDVMFTCVNLARHFSLDADRVLREANQRFEQRFRCMERQAQAERRPLADCDSDELERRWQAAKRTLATD